MTTSINRATRAAALDHLASAPYDLIVVGGGITGAGVVLDAASRGLRAALVERVDLAAGTSRWSSKLVHGGLRYLVKGDVAIAWESARERHHLMTSIAPHLTRAAANLFPLGGATPPAMGAAAEAGMRVASTLRALAGTPAASCPARRASVQPRRSPSRRGCVATTCAARSSTGTASSRTTRGSSSPSPGRPRGSAPTSSPGAAPSSSATAACCCATS